MEKTPCLYRTGDLGTMQMEEPGSSAGEGQGAEQQDQC